MAESIGSGQFDREPFEYHIESLEARRMLSVSTDTQGWTVFGRSDDTRIVYVSSSAGDDTNSGLSETAAVKTLTKAKSLLRNGAPDWMLLKRGDAWSENLNGWTRSGRNADEPMVIGAYGDGARPKLNTGTSVGFSNNGNPVAHLAVVGIHFHAHTRDTASPTYSGVTAGSNGFNSSGRLTNVLIEDAVFDDYVYNLSLTPSTGSITDFTLRRSVITDAWSVIDKSQGLYADGVNGFVLEGNVFAHNGWNEDVSGAGATIYSHSVYMSSRNSGVVVRENIIADSASHGLQARSGGVIEDNVFLRNPINLLFGGGSPTVKAGGVEGRVTGNVILDSRSIAGSPRGTGLELSNLKPGADVVVADNIFTADAHRVSAAITFGLTSDATNIAESMGINDLTLRDNIVFDWHSAWNMSTSFRLGATGNRGVNNVRIVDNDFQNTAVGRIVRHGPAVNTAELYWEDNRYDNAFPSSGWFQVGADTVSFDAWRTNVEPTARDESGAYADPSRSIASYNVSLGGEAAFGAFLAAARGHDRRTLDGRYTAPAVINYIREGFAEGGIVPGGAATTYGPQDGDATPVDRPPTDPADVTGPTAQLTNAPLDLTTLGTAAHLFTVTYRDESAIDLNTVGSSDVLVTGPTGATQNATLISKTTADNGKTVIAVYGAPAPGGYWDPGDNGAYTLALVAGAVRDTLGNSSTPADFGAFTVDVSPDSGAPIATLTPPPDITTGGTAPQTFLLTYTDETGIDLASIGTGDVIVTGPAGEARSATYVSRTVTNDGRTVAAVYTLAAPNGYWGVADSGTYAIALADGAVRDVLGQGTSAAAFGSFSVAPPPDDAGPTVALSAPALTAGGTSPYAFTVTFNDATAVDAASVGAGDVRVIGPGGEELPVTYVSQQSSNSGRTIAAVYRIAAPGGWWDAGENGTYDVSLVDNAARDVIGNTTPAATLGAFAVNVPADGNAPAATVPASSVTARGDDVHAFTVVYTDATAVDVASVGADDVRVTGPGGFTQTASFVSRSASADAKTVTAIYTISAPGGEWDYFDNGTYQIALNAGAVRDLPGNANGSVGIGSFAVKILDTVAPVATLSAIDRTTTGSDAHRFTIIYQDDIGLNLSTIGAGDARVVRVSGPNGYQQEAAFVSREVSNDGKTVAAVYSVMPPGGSWDAADDGTYQVKMGSAEVADLAGNTTAVGAIGAFAVAVGPPADTTAPTVTDVFVSGTGWTTSFKNFLASSGQGDGEFGYRLNASDHADELPWVNLNRISIRFSEDVNVTADDFAVRGVNVAQYAGFVFAYDASSRTASWTLPATTVFNADKLLLDLDGGADGVADASGNVLDGEWANPTAPAHGGANSFPSGNGNPGGDFHFRLNVLPGDVNRSGGSVVGSDVTLTRNAQNSPPGGENSLYTIFKDVNGSASILGSDVTLVRNRQGIRLPAGEPESVQAT